MHKLKLIQRIVIALFILALPTFANAQTEMSEDEFSFFLFNCEDGDGIQDIGNLEKCIKLSFQANDVRAGRATRAIVKILDEEREAIILETIANEYFVYGEDKLKISDGYFPTTLLHYVIKFDSKYSKYVLYRLLQNEKNKLYYQNGDIEQLRDSYLKQAAITPDSIPDSNLSREIVRSYLERLVTDSNTLETFYTEVLPACSICSREEFHVKILQKTATFSETTDTSISSTPESSVVDNMVFAAFLNGGKFDIGNARHMIARAGVFNIQDIPKFMSSFEVDCKECDYEQVLRALQETEDYGSGLENNFFTSIEYNYILSALPYADTVESFFAYRVKTPDDYAEFFTAVLPKCAECDVEDYALRSLKKLETGYMRLNLETFSSSPIFKHVITNTPYQVDSKTNKNVYSIRLKSAGRVLKQDIEGSCSFSRKATEVKDAGFLDTLFTGADARRNYYDIYQCNLSDKDKSVVVDFAKSIQKAGSVSGLKEGFEWEYYKYTGDEKIVYERSPSSYTPTEPYESSQSSSSSDTGIRTDGDGRIYIEGREIANMDYSYGSWRIHCSRGRKSGNSDWNEYENKDQVIATAIRWCKK